MRKIKLDYTSEGEEVRRASKEVLNGAQSSSAVTVGEDYFVEFFHKEKKIACLGCFPRKFSSGVSIGACAKFPRKETRMGIK